MTVIQPNSITGITSLTCTSDSLAIHNSSGALIQNLVSGGITTTTALSVSGVSTMTGGVNVGTAATIKANGNATFSGIVTSSAADLQTGPLNVGTAATISANGNATFSGIVTATTYYGSGANLTGITGTTINNNADNRVITGSGSANTLEGESNLTFTGDILQVSSTTQGLGAKYINTGNEYTNIQFSAARTAADNALGILNAKWNNNHEVAAIYLTTGDDTTNKDDGKIKFYTSAASGSLASRLEILNDGDVKVSDGDLVIGTSGHGIDFGATADGTGSSQAEIFDDYEEGDWTPTVSSGNATFSSMSGRYTKVGRNVSLWYRISSGGSYSGSSALQIGGVPFANNSSGVHPVGTSEFYKVNFASGYSDYCSCYMSGNNIQWLRNSSGSGSGNYLTIDLFYSGAAITGWIQYYTDS